MRLIQSLRGLQRFSLDPTTRVAAVSLSAACREYCTGVRTFTGSHKAKEAIASAGLQPYGRVQVHARRVSSAAKNIHHRQPCVLISPLQTKPFMCNIISTMVSFTRRKVDAL